MKKIPVDKIEDGMVLAKPLMGSAGNVLLSEGIVLKQSMISRLKNWDVPVVVIQSDDEPAEEVAAPVAVEFRTDELDAKFKDVMKNPIMKIVYEATRDYFQNKHNRDKIDLSATRTIPAPEAPRKP
jgi:hypothetical protein